MNCLDFHLIEFNTEYFSNEQLPDELCCWKQYAVQPPAIIGPKLDWNLTFNEKEHQDSDERTRQTYERRDSQCLMPLAETRWKWWWGGRKRIPAGSVAAQWVWLMPGLLGLFHKTAVSSPHSLKPAWWVIKTQEKSGLLNWFFYTFKKRNMSFLKKDCGMMSHLTSLFSYTFLIFYKSI